MIASSETRRFRSHYELHLWARRQRSLVMRAMLRRAANELVTSVEALIRLAAAWLRRPRELRRLER